MAEALAIYSELGDRRGVANTNWALGLDAIAHRDWTAARASIEASLAAYREIDDPFGAGWALHELALIEAYTGDPQPAEARGAGSPADLPSDAADLSAAVLLLLDLVFIKRLLGHPDRVWRLAGPPTRSGE